METAFLFAILASLFYLAGFIPYLYHTFRGRVVPHAFSWTVWAILSAINTYALYRLEGMTESMIPTLTRTGCLMIGAIVSWFLIRKIRITGFDYIAVGLWILCLYIASHFWVENAIIPTIIVDILVLTPTLKKIWHDPYSEWLTAWTLTIGTMICILLSLPIVTFESAVFWAYAMLMNAMVALYIVLRRRYPTKTIKKPVVRKREFLYKNT